MQDGTNAEKAILGAILLDSQAIYQCGELKATDFSLSSHRTIFSAMNELSSGSRAIDMVTLVDHLGPKLHGIGDVGYLSSLVDGVPDRPHIEHYISIVASLSRRRRLVALCDATMKQCDDQSESTEDCISVAVDRLLELAGATSRKSIKLSDYSFDVYQRIRNLAKTPLSDLPIGLPTGFPGIDHLTSGLLEGEMWTVATWTGDGKTVFVTQVAVNNLKLGNPVLVFTIEMNKRAFLQRMIPQITDGAVKGRHLRDPRHMTGAQLMAFDRAQKTMDDWPLWVNDASSQDIMGLYSHALMMVKRHGIKLIVVDYLQLVKGRGERNYERVSDVSNQLRELAKNSGVPVLVVSQLSRAENREKRTPRIFDLKESGSIENDSHVILLPYRPQEKDGRYSGEDLLIVGKMREGQTGVVQARFDSLTLTFQPRGKEDYERYDEAQQSF